MQLISAKLTPKALLWSTAGACSPMTGRGADGSKWVSASRNHQCHCCLPVMLAKPPGEISPSDLSNVIAYITGRRLMCKEVSCDVTAFDVRVVKVVKADPQSGLQFSVGPKYSNDLRRAARLGPKILKYATRPVY